MMQKIKFTTYQKSLLSDTATPVAWYLKLRDHYPGSFLLESSDYHARENSFSYLCLQPIASVVVEEEIAKVQLPNQDLQQISLKETTPQEVLHQFIQSFAYNEINEDYITHGLFGYTAYDAIQHFYPLKWEAAKVQIPLMHYQVFRYVIVMDHFKQTVHLLEHVLEEAPSTLPKILEILQQPSVPQFQFSLFGEESTNLSDETFLKHIQQGKEWCQMGEVFQIVLSRRYVQGYKGDDFQVYRALRSVNPSPYLFYFDFGNFKIFGSSPEAQLQIKNNKAVVHPIAGTFKRTGILEEDLALAEKLKHDPKEIAEHRMLVDLARNDLSKVSKNVQVTQLEAIEMYSHVIHLVSKVEASLPEGTNPIDVLAETFPAGTLSGAPKYRAMQGIASLEPIAREWYGGAIGYIGFQGNINHAIAIRSFLCRNNLLEYQAGCGIVLHSEPEKELMEVHHKLGALRKALQLAPLINANKTTVV